MKNKKKYFLIFLFLFLFLLLFFVFSGIFSDSPQSMTAKVIDNFRSKEGTLFKSTCYDSDGTNYYEKGYREFKGKVQEEFCLSVESTGKMYVKEYYCYGEVVQECPGNCVEGACIKEEGKILSNFVEDIKGFFRKII